MIAMRVEVTYYNSFNELETDTLDFIHKIEIYEFDNKNYIEFIRKETEVFRYNYDKVKTVTITK